MASPNYNHHPLPAPPSSQQGQQYGTHQPPAPHAQFPLQHQSQPSKQSHHSHQSVPLSQAPPVQKPERTRPRSRGFSFRSDKSKQSSGSHQHHKLDLHETSAEKEAKRLHADSKADPSVALSEREPAMEAQQAQQLAPLRSLEHKDANGNPIADPDRSNPTRNRWERPLDTIRSFEAAIDGGYNRNSIYRSDSESVAQWNRRSSYYGNNGPRFPQDSYYGGRPNSSFRPESAMVDPRQAAMMMGPRDSYHDGLDGSPYGYGATGGRNRYSRMQSDPYLGNRPPEKNLYPMPNNHRSYETVASGTGSGSLGEPAGYQTDPTSSENSSIDRRSPPKRQEPVNDYGISFGQSPTYQSPSFGTGKGAAGTPPVPRKDNGSLLRKSAVPNGTSQERPGTGEKRKSWLLRRFSKKS